MLDVSVKGVNKTLKFLKAEQKAQKKDLSTATRVEGFRLMKLLKRQIRQGNPGGRRFKPLSFIARYNWGRRRNNPLSRLAIGIRYWLPRTHDPEFHFGWVGPKVSKSWKRLAKKHQEGFTSDLSKEKRNWWYERKHSDRVPKKYRKYFGISKRRTQLVTPARPILDPFWRAVRAAAMRNIANNYVRKRRGERI